MFISNYILHFFTLDPIQLILCLLSVTFVSLWWNILNLACRYIEFVFFLLLSVPTCPFNFSVQLPHFLLLSLSSLLTSFHAPRFSSSSFYCSLFLLLIFLLSCALFSSSSSSSSSPPPPLSHFLLVFCWLLHPFILLPRLWVFLCHCCSSTLREVVILKWKVSTQCAVNVTGVWHIEHTPTYSRCTQT